MSSVTGSFRPLWVLMLALVVWPSALVSAQGLNASEHCTLNPITGKPDCRKHDYDRGVSPITMLDNHLADLTHIVSENFFQCLAYQPKLCVCFKWVVTPKGVSLRAAPQISYRAPTQKVESGIRTPLFTGYRMQEEIENIQIPLIKAFDETGFTKVATDIRITAARGKAKAAQTLRGLEVTDDPPNAFGRSQEEIVDDVLTNPEYGVFERSDDDRFRAQDTPTGGYRPNEYHAMVEPSRDLLFDATNSILPFGMCHHKRPLWPATYFSDIPTEGYLVGKYPDMTPALGGEFTQMYVAMSINPLLCTGLNMVQGLTPPDLVPPRLQGPASAPNPNPCLKNNHGPMAPFNSVAITKYDPVAAGVGLRKGLTIASAKFNSFYRLRPDNDRVQWRGDGLPTKCMDLEPNYQSGVFGRGMQAESNPEGNVGILWSEFTCCAGMPNPDFMVGACDSNYRG